MREVSEDQKALALASIVGHVFLAGQSIFLTQALPCLLSTHETRLGQRHHFKDAAARVQQEIQTRTLSRA